MAAIDCIKEVRDMLNATLDSLSITWADNGKKVETNINSSKGAGIWLADFAERVRKDEQQFIKWVNGYVEFLKDQNIMGEKAYLDFDSMTIKASSQTSNVEWTLDQFRDWYEENYTFQEALDEDNSYS